LAFSSHHREVCLMLQIVASYVLPVCCGAAANYLTLLRSRGRRAIQGEVIGWVVALALAAALFPSSWRNMEIVSCGLFLWYFLGQALLCLIVHPLVRRVARRRIGSAV
jgi:asparagine N-glycosylation enzyme membrane subunit Stt3